MEFSLVSKRGVPEDAIISIRSGTVRRQGGVATDKPFRFPQGASDADCVVKIDIMQNIGSGYLVMRPGLEGCKQYEVVMNDDMACEIAVQPAGGSAPGASSAQDESAAAKTKQDAKAYLESTGLLPFVQGVLQVVAKQQPQDPFAAMAKHFNSASDEAVPPQVGSPKAAPATPKVVAALEEEAAPSGTPVAAAVEEAKSAPPPAAEEETNAAPPATAEEAKPSEEKAEAASPPAKEEENAAPPTAAEEAKASDAPPDLEDAHSDHVDDNKSDTLEEFTSKVAENAQAVETLAAAAAVAAGAPAGVAAATLAAEQAETAPAAPEAAPAVEEASPAAPEAAPAVEEAS